MPPFLKLEGHTLRWRRVNDEDPTATWRDVDPDGMLTRFIKIRSDQDVLRFAARYGPLMLCGKHGLPASHNYPSRYGQDDACLPLGWLDRGGPDDPGEPLARWYYFVSMARSILELATALHAGDAIPRGAVRQLIERDPAAERLSGRREQDYIDMVDVRVTTAASDREHAKREAAWAVDSWLELGNVRPELLWSGEERLLQLGADTFGALGIQLINAITAFSIAACSHCGDLIPRFRKPQRGRRIYCEKPECKKWGARERKRKQLRENPQQAQRRPRR